MSQSSTVYIKEMSQYPELRAVHVEEPLVAVHPHLRQAGRIDAVGVLVARERVGVERTEDVPHPGARDGLQGAPAHPHLGKRFIFTK